MKVQPRPVLTPACISTSQCTDVLDVKSKQMFLLGLLLSCSEIIYDTQ